MSDDPVFVASMTSLSVTSPTPAWITLNSCFIFLLNFCNEPNNASFDESESVLIMQVNTFLPELETANCLFFRSSRAPARARMYCSFETTSK